MSRARQASEPDGGRAVPRPGALLVAAAAVPLGAAAVLAAGLLPAGPRIALGIALAVLGRGLLAEVGTAVGARVGAPTLRAIGVAGVAVGLLLAAGGATVALVDLVADEGVAEGVGPTGIAGGPAAIFAALVAASGAATALVASRRIGALVAGAGGAVGVHAVLGLDAIGLVGDARASGLLLVAALAGAEGLRRGADDDVGRGLLVAAGVLLAVTRGEGTQLLGAVAGGVVALADGSGSPTGRGARAAVGAALAAVLLVAAVVRRDAVTGVLPLGVLVLDQGADGTAEPVGVLLVAGVATVLLVVLAGAARRRDHVARGAVLAAVAVALLLALDVGARVLPGVRGPREGTVVVTVVLGCASVLVLAAVAVLARAMAGRPGTALGVTALLCLVVGSPFETIRRAGPESWSASVPATAVASLLALLVAGAVVHRRREPLVLAAAALVLAGAFAVVLRVAVFRGRVDSPGDVALALLAQAGPAVLLATAAGIVSLLGRSRLLPGVQSAGAALLVLAALTAVGAAQLLQGLGPVGDAGPDPDGPALEGGPLVVAVALLLLLAVAGSLLAASTARRRSPHLAVAGVGAALGVAVLAAGIGAAAAPSHGSTDDPTAPGDRPDASVAGLALGLRTVAPFARDVGAGWPVLLGVLGTALLAAAWWLESRRPVPAGAPVG